MGDQLGPPCLDGLPPDVAHIVFAFLPTKDAAPLSRVNQAMKQLVTDDTRGVYRHLVIGVDEREWWDRGIRRTAWQTGESLGIDGDGSSEEDGNYDEDEDEEEEGNDEEGEDGSAGEGATGGAALRRQREQDALDVLKQKMVRHHTTPTNQRLGLQIFACCDALRLGQARLRTVHISTHWKGLDFPLECIEASHDTVRSMKLCEKKRLEDDDEFEDYHYSVPTYPPSVAFSQLEDLYVEKWPYHHA